MNFEECVKIIKEAEKSMLEYAKLLNSLGEIELTEDEQDLLTGKIIRVSKNFQEIMED